MKQEIYRLSEICKLYAGGDAPEEVSEERTADFCYPVFSNGLINEGLYGYCKRATMKADTITISARGTIGAAFYRTEPYLPIVRLITVDPDDKKINRKYLYYYLQMNKLEGYGTSQQQLTIPFMKKKKILVFSDIGIQEKIANMLNNYDRLIDLNKKRIKTLERMAEAIYKEWFVRFRFPNHENNKFVGGIPEKWYVEKLSNLFFTSSGGTPSRQQPEFYEGNIPWIKTGELKDSYIFDTEEHITEEAIKKSSAKIIKPGSLLLAMYAGSNVGNMGFTLVESTCNQACCVFNPKKNVSLNYLFHYLKMLRPYLQSISFGAAQQNISQELLKKVKILVPDQELLCAFDNATQSINDEIIALLEQNNSLIKQRNMLLPRLMSGKLSVEGKEIV